VPWCLRCDRYLTPPTVRADGTCPSCGQLVDAGRAHAPRRPHADADHDQDAPPVPWHLKLLLLALAIYLTYRLVQGVAWLIAHL